MNCCAYRDELNQVWINLIHNALQARDNCGVLKVEVKSENQSRIVSVTDSGKGIFPGILPIFEPFSTTKPAGEGSGLGVEIVKKSVERPSGKMEVTSVIGQRTFIVSIPIALNGDRTKNHTDARLKM
ncbi:ATP-binding protein [Microcoleus sp. A003_D6]|uniref:ATP-binding protein n=1 Tax=Microcoleus sp. A003_D6 TaxID=3055266 RepID=UPI002FD6F8DB